MFYSILLKYVNDWHLANLMIFTIFRSIIACLISFFITFMIAPKVSFKLRKLQKRGQPIRSNVSDIHLTKIGTPTMGGITIIFSILFTILVLIDLNNPYVWLVVFVLITFGFIGFLDDYIKLSRFNHCGIRCKTKLFFQFLFAVIAFAGIEYYSLYSCTTKLSIPFFKTILIDSGYFYLPFVLCVIIGSSNALNLTDGLDGLAIGVLIIVSSAFAIICYLVGNVKYASHLHILYIPRATELTVICAIIAGSGLGFLWYNCSPAEVFMGDTGSLPLGAVIGTISVITKQEFTLFIVGGLLVIETASVILQVCYFKITKGKRFFRMAPIHHHFEKKGFSETKIVIRCWIISVTFALIGLLSLKLK